MKKTVLLIDDSVTIHRVIDLSIDSEKYDVEKVFSKEDASIRLSNAKFDFILLDNKLDNIIVADYVEELKRLNPNSFVILLIGAFDRFEPADLSKSHADDYLVKPFDSQSLNAKLQNDNLIAPELNEDIITEEAENIEEADSEDENEFNAQEKATSNDEYLKTLEETLPDDMVNGEEFEDEEEREARDDAQNVIDVIADMDEPLTDNQEKPVYAKDDNDGMLDDAEDVKEATDEEIAEAYTQKEGPKDEVVSVSLKEEDTVTALDDIEAPVAILHEGQELDTFDNIKAPEETAEIPEGIDEVTSRIEKAALTSEELSGLEFIENQTMKEIDLGYEELEDAKKAEDLLSGFGDFDNSSDSVNNNDEIAHIYGLDKTSEDSPEEMLLQIMADDSLDSIRDELPEILPTIDDIDIKENDTIFKDLEKEADSINNIDDISEEFEKKLDMLDTIAQVEESLPDDDELFVENETEVVPETDYYNSTNKSQESLQVPEIVKKEAQVVTQVQSGFSGGITINISKEEIVAMLGQAIDKRFLEEALKETLAKNIGEVVREIVPALAEKYLKEEIDRLKNE